MSGRPSGNRPKSAFSALFLPFSPFPESLKSTRKIQKTEEKGLFPRISSDFLKPPALKPPFAALQVFQAGVPRLFIILCASFFSDSFAYNTTIRHGFGDLLALVAVDAGKACPREKKHYEECYLMESLL